MIEANRRYRAVTDLYFKRLNRGQDEQSLVHWVTSIINTCNDEKLSRMLANFRGRMILSIVLTAPKEKVVAQ